MGLAAFLQFQELTNSEEAVKSYLHLVVVILLKGKDSPTIPYHSSLLE